MPQVSAGLLLCRPASAGGGVLLAHPGGPFFQKKDRGAWTIPKGLVEDREDVLAAARREFAEELGFEPVQGDVWSLGSVTQKSGKVVHAWAVRGSWDPAELSSNTFEMEWPPRSGVRKTFPEVDRAQFFSLDEAARQILAAQVPFLERAAMIPELFAD